eukprot:978542-Rhodomonas_salina.1
MPIATVSKPDDDDADDDERAAKIMMSSGSRSQKGLLQRSQSHVIPLPSDSELSWEIGAY